MRSSVLKIVLSFAYKLNVDFNSGKVMNGKKIYMTTPSVIPTRGINQAGCLILHPCGAVQWIGNSMVDE